MKTRPAIKIAGVALTTMVACSTSLFGQNFTWIQTSAPTNLSWNSIASSSDGTKLAAAASPGGIFTSTNSGTTWIQTSAPNTENGGNEVVASSGDGTKLVASAYYVGIFTSANTGMTWTQTTAPVANWWSVASSSDGTKLAAANDSGGGVLGINGYGGGIYTSTNSGASWTQTTSGGVTFSVASSCDGSTLIAGVNLYGSLGYLDISTNSGNAWTESGIPNAADGCAVAVSGDGTKLIAAALGSGIYISTNSGTSWTHTSAPTNQAWLSVASSSDGTKLVAGSFNGEIFASTNSGMTWTQQIVPTNYAWTAIASSCDGTKLVAAAENGGIYTGALLVAPPITAPTILVNGQFQFSFDTATGVNYAVQCSTNLTQWLPLMTLGGVGTPLTVTDTNTAGYQQRFYRIVLSPQ